MSAATFQHFSSCRVESGFASGKGCSISVIPPTFSNIFMAFVAKVLAISALFCALLGKYVSVHLAAADGNGDYKKLG